MDNKKAYDDFISTVSHELRTPLTSIRGFSQTMLSSWEKLDDENKKKFLQIIEQQSNRLIALVENMLSVSKLQSDENFIYKNYSANKLIEPVLQIIKQQYKNHIINSKFNNKIPDIFVDCDKFQQIMTNLIENAAKYSNEGSNIEVITEFAENKPDYISIKVKDQGIGIKEADKEKIFYKFSRIDNPLTRKVQGSGLGLYITKTLVDKMNGEMILTSSDYGSVFEVLFPSANIENQVGVKCVQKHF